MSHNTAADDTTQPEISTIARNTLKLLWVIVGVAIVVFVAFVVVPFLFHWAWAFITGVWDFLVEGIFGLPRDAWQLAKDGSPWLLMWCLFLIISSFSKK